MKNAVQLSSKDWFGKASAGLILGFVFALGASGLLAWALQVQDTFFSTKGQLAMWFIAPVWAFTVSFCFFFSSGLRAWMWLSAINIVVWGLVWVGRMA